MSEKNIDKSRSNQTVGAFLKAARSVPVGTEPQTEPGGRLLFAMDATASRQPSWDMACRLQADMFKAAAEAGGLSVQLIFFRGFGECRASDWVADADRLRQKMTAVRCRGGQTQIGAVLRHALAENKKRKINAIVLVGDAFEESLDGVAHLAGRLGLVGVPVFAFQEGHDPLAAQAFRQFAALTRGAHLPFDLKSASVLKDLLGAVAQFAAGGLPAVEARAANADAGARLLLTKMER